MELIKKIAKYTVNILCIISALIAGFNSIDGIIIPYASQIIQGIAVVNGVIGTYLLGTNVVKKIEEGK